MKTSIPGRAHRFCRVASRRGMALILSLFFVVLLTFLVLTFFSRAMLDRQIATSSSAQIQVDNLARAAFKIVVGELRQEIASGSRQDVSYTVNGTTIYVPSTVTASVPCPAISTTGTLSTTLPNLVKKSVRGLPFFRGDSYNALFPASNYASALNTYAPSIGGFLRSIDVKQWSKPLLLPDGALTAADLPDWIFVDNDGPKVITQGSSTITGRYAYMIYNVGNLIDISVAGSLSTLNLQDGSYSNNAVRGGRPGVPLVDLTMIPGLKTADIDKIVGGWRNKVSAASTGSYTNYISNIGREHGFTRTMPGDQTYLGRQDLLNYWKNEGLDTTALPYLTAFNRQKSAPSFAPDTTRPKVGDSGVKYDGKTYRTTTFGRDDEFNPPLANIRWPADATLYAGTSDEVTVKKGSSFLLKRFYLGRIALLSQASPDATLVKRYFGLTSNGKGGWVYNHGADKKIYTLKELTDAIAAGTVEAREPDFFELLQAGLCLGSLGRDSGLTGTQATSAFQAAFYRDQNTYLHVLRIGANIIDQYDADSYPTEITLGSDPLLTVYGVEDLPYISKINAYVGGRPDGANVGGWFVFEMWKPHRVPPPVALSGAPAQFRIVASGQAYVTAKVYKVDASGTRTETETTPNSSTTFVADPPNSAIYFDSTTADFSDPVTLDATNLATAKVTPDDNYKNVTSEVRGLYVGDAPAYPTGTASSKGVSSSGIKINGAITFYVQYQHPIYGWKTYDTMYNVANAARVTHDLVWSVLAKYHLNPLYSYCRIDPRVDRLGNAYVANANPGSDYLYSSEGSKNRSLRTVLGYYGYNMNASWAIPDKNSGFTQDASDGNWQLGSLEVNAPRVSGSNTGAPNGEPNGRARYVDPDGVMRGADGFYSGYQYGEGHPILQRASYSETLGTWTRNRPIMLNRPFRNVGELGYACRDLPWKSVDFFTAKSGDTALLDLFSASEDTDSVAGKVNPNTPHTAVLKALLNGALINEGASPSGSADLISSDTADKLAKAIVAESAGKPFANRGDLISRVSADLGTNSEVYADRSTTVIKSRREAMIRALSETTGTRTWNLMIDVIAQTGHFPPKAGAALDSFVPNGEKRYWIHLAIDRYTGEVVDQRLEAVNE
jgi:hypothetical protein